MPGGSLDRANKGCPKRTRLLSAEYAATGFRAGAMYAAAHRGVHLNRDIFGTRSHRRCLLFICRQQDGHFSAPGVRGKQRKGDCTRMIGRHLGTGGAGATGYSRSKPEGFTRLRAVSSSGRPQARPGGDCARGHLARQHGYDRLRNRETMQAAGGMPAALIG